MSNDFATKPRAKIKNAEIQRWSGSDVLIGFCTEHEGRPDLVNRIIHTSAIVKIEGNYVETRNTRYQVEWLP
jgi:hypothetical protein